MMNAVLNKYFEKNSKVFLVDSNDLIKWNKTSCWNVTSHQMTHSFQTAELTAVRRRKAESMRKFVISFHHTSHNTTYEHWSLFVAFLKKSIDVWIIEHYDFDFKKSSIVCRTNADSENILQTYLSWLMLTSVFVRMKLKMNDTLNEWQNYKDISNWFIFRSASCKRMMSTATFFCWLTRSLFHRVRQCLQLSI